MGWQDWVLAGSTAQLGLSPSGASCLGCLSLRLCPSCLRRSLLAQGQRVTAGAGSCRVSRPARMDGAESPCAGAAQDPCALGLPHSLASAAFPSLWHVG